MPTSSPISSIYDPGWLLVVTITSILITSCLEMTTPHQSSIKCTCSVLLMILLAMFIWTLGGYLSSNLLKHSCSTQIRLSSCPHSMTMAV